jgi:hypothetical protein
MRAALPLKATNARAERAEERARANALRAQIDELNAELVVVRAEADRALAEERQRVDRLNEQVEALSAEVVRAEKQAEAVVGRAERAEAGRDAERAHADALRNRVEALQVQLAQLEAKGAASEVQAAELTAQLKQARAEAKEAAHAAAELRQAVAEQRARGLLARLRAAWRGEGKRPQGWLHRLTAGNPAETNAGREFHAMRFLLPVALVVRRAMTMVAHSQPKATTSPGSVTASRKRGPKPRTEREIDPKVGAKVDTFFACMVRPPDND